MATNVRALRLDRIWRVRLLGRTRWQFERGGEVDRADALRVRRDVYRIEMGCDLGVEGDDVDSRVHLCVVRTVDDRPVASLRIGGPDDRPFDLDRFVNLEPLFPPGARPAEMSRFAVLPEFRLMTTGVHMAAFDFAFHLAERERYTHFVLMAVEERIAMWRWLLFEETGLIFRHPFGNEPHVLMLDLRGVAQRYKAARHALAPLLTRVQDAPQLA